ncbi:MAG: NAD(P)H-dependent oxidoreductase subunit E [Dissulfuribacterales bacterium]
MQVLHVVQNAYGYLESSVLARVVFTLHVPLSRVYGVATFYHHFNLTPAGQNTCILCTGTTCFIKGGERILKALKAEFGISMRQTTSYGRLTLLTARCLGACSMAPVALVNGKVMGNLTPDALCKHLKEVMPHAS